MARRDRFGSYGTGNLCVGVRGQAPLRWTFLHLGAKRARTLIAAFGLTARLPKPGWELVLGSGYELRNHGGKYELHYSGKEPSDVAVRWETVLHAARKSGSIEPRTNGRKTMKTMKAKRHPKKTNPTVRASEIPEADYYVTATDTFMSGWGGAEGKRNIVVGLARSFKEAEVIADNLRARSEMRRVSISRSRPRANRGVVYSVLGGPHWTTPGAWKKHQAEHDKERGKRKRAPRPANVSQTDVRELVLYITNDADLYHRQVQLIIANLAKKTVRGLYSETRAIDLWMHLANAGDKKYKAEHSTRGPGYMLTADTRRAVAKELQKYYEEELRDVTENLLGGKTNPRGGAPAARPEGGHERGGGIWSTIKDFIG